MRIVIKKTTTYVVEIKNIDKMRKDELVEALEDKIEHIVNKVTPHEEEITINECLNCQNIRLSTHNVITLQGGMLYGSAKTGSTYSLPLTTKAIKRQIKRIKK